MMHSAPTRCSASNRPVSDSILPAFGQFERRLRLEIRCDMTSELSRTPIGLALRSAKFGASPGVQLQEVHSIASTSHIVDTAGEPSATPRDRPARHRRSLRNPPP